MKSITFSIAAAFLALTSVNMYADSFTPTLKTGTTIDALTETDLIIGGVAAKQFTYVNEEIGTLGAFGAVLSSSTSTFTATYLEVSHTAAVLDVTDVCATVYLLGSGPSCQSFAFSLNDIVLGDGELGNASVDVLLNATANVGLGVAGLNINGNDPKVQGLDIAGASIGGGGGSFNINPVPSPTPEPGSLCLMATGLVGAAGAIRRRLAAGAASDSEVA